MGLEVERRQSQDRVLGGMSGRVSQITRVPFFRLNITSFRV
jgi:hypothetical protein